MAVHLDALRKNRNPQHVLQNIFYITVYIFVIDGSSICPKDGDFRN
jgi:hypothetical protein